MMDLLAEYYLWTKALHIMAVISWMAGLFYLPRLYVYHAERAVPGDQLSEALKVMERKLLRLIMNPAMIATWLFGGMLLATPGIVDWSAGWVWVKLVLISAMTVYHHMLSSWRKQFDQDRNERSGRYYRLWNEAPTLLMVGIVLMVVLKPF